jgi:pectin methylesterase-like acyl-CoA thioesterase
MSLPGMLFVNKDNATCNGNSPCYTSIQEAMNAASSGSAIKIAQGSYTESIVLNELKSLTLQGGWDSSFTTQTSNTTFIKAPKANQGSLTLQVVTIKP